MKKSLIALICLSFACLQDSFAQGEKAERDKFVNTFIKNFRFPREVSEQCKSSFVSVVIEVRDSKVSDELGFSKNIPASLKQEIEKQKLLMKGTDWAKIFPDIGKKKNYNIYIPFIYYLDLGCMEKIRSEEFSQIIEGAFNINHKLKDATYMLEPLVFEVFKPRP